jgi:NAD+ synthase
MAEAAKIADWIRNQVSESGQNGIAVGLSGGIDSSVVAVLAKKAMGDNVLGVLMPCESNPEDGDHALLLAKEFDIDTEFIDLTPVYQLFKEQLPSGSQLADANLKPRLRMSTLYYIANIHRYLVAGTGNRSELEIGYFTKYGDGGADILPIGNLLKIEVRELAEDLGIPQEIIAKPPSAGLWEGQTDENEMGFTYEELDKVIAKAEKEGYTPQTKTEQTIIEMMKSSRHKRSLPPIYKQEIE